LPPKSVRHGSLDETRHNYYSDDWQVLEERVGGLFLPRRLGGAGVGRESRSD
jgi:hypothetical protein